LFWYDGNLIVVKAAAIAVAATRIEEEEKKKEVETSQSICFFEYNDTTGSDEDSLFFILWLISRMKYHAQTACPHSLLCSIVYAICI
jgi:hypothetical protein